MSETWTEYAVRYEYNGRPCYTRATHLVSAQADLRVLRGLVPLGVEAAIVGRQVTASDWLPVDTDGAK